MGHHIASLQHPLVKHLVKLRKNSDYRHEHKSLLIDGEKLVSEVCSKTSAHVVLALNETLIPQVVKAKDIVIVTEEIMHKISGMQSPEGILAEVPMPLSDPLTNKRYLIALDRVSDPGNMGTLLRTALALGWEGAFILEESCDPFNEKAIRAARGATFRLPTATGNWENLLKIIKQNQLTPFAADLEGKNPQKIKEQNGILLVLSNEAHGLSKEAAAHCEKITIPMPGPMESLNVSVAGGILMYCLKH
jgi:TrmH family RNA methyltransferase